MKNIVCLIDYFGTLQFFANLAKSDANNRYIFLTTSPLCYKLLIRDGIEVHLITLVSRSESGLDFSAIETASILPLRLSYVSLGRTKVFARRVFYRLKRVYERLGEDDFFIFVWNGNSLMGEVARCFGKLNPKIRLGFFETANIPGKTFIDSRGVNKSSSLFSCPELLDDLQCNEADADDLSKNYISLKKIYKRPLRENISSTCKILEFSYHAILGYRYVSFSKLFNVLRAKKKAALNKACGDGEIPSSYVLFPMQVRTDTQLVLNSKLDTLNAIKIVLERESQPIVVTPHPHDAGALSILEALDAHDLKRIYISYRNTFDLVRDAVKVYVINSTVGLECMLLGKDVEFLGQSFYSRLTGERLGKYIFSFLVDIDPYSNERLSTIQINSIFNILDKTEQCQPSKIETFFGILSHPV